MACYIAPRIAPIRDIFATNNEQYSAVLSGEDWREGYKKSICAWDIIPAGVMRMWEEV